MEEESSRAQENRETTLYAKTQSASCTLALRQSAGFIYLPGTKSRLAAAAATAAWNVRNGGVDFLCTCTITFTSAAGSAKVG